MALAMLQFTIRGIKGELAASGVDPIAWQKVFHRDPLAFHTDMVIPAFLLGFAVERALKGVAIQTRTDGGYLQTHDLLILWEDISEIQQSAIAKAVAYLSKQEMDPKDVKEAVRYHQHVYNWRYLLSGDSYSGGISFTSLIPLARGTCWYLHHISSLRRRSQCDKAVP